MHLIRAAAGDSAQALDAYEAAIAVYPNRYRSVAGAAHAAGALGDDAAVANPWPNPFPELLSGPIKSFINQCLRPSASPELFSGPIFCGSSQHGDAMRQARGLPPPLSLYT
mmetsp:Transcript_20691/g.42056  ORF Transcript_20691/g.42056 Transcript_20691/m.42056 type:complete len:111 (-) Transcript_20691:446-778(-)